ncbi:MAG: transposase [Candidatus Omnitrophica bacterium]|nr:transposase [Candidatus Omnitrophota bacterium]MDD5592094.1 transposase [Candidatus Omnitrophota bacterium]
MPRTARITIENSCYHIITRGNQKQSVFRNPQDYEKYLNILIKYKRRYKFKLYCFCLMPNHVHLIIEVENPFLLNKIMRGLNLSYTLYFNYRYKTVGHLWQDRYKSKIIHKDGYFLACINYIETNPLRASITANINGYRWSSYVFRLKNSLFLDDIPLL